MRSIIVTSLVTGLSLLFSINAHAYQYSIKDLGTLHDTSKNILYVMLGGLNDHGAISGTIVNQTLQGPPARHAVIWDSEGRVKQFDSLGGSSFGTGLNNSGQVIGVSYLADNFYAHAVLWSDNSVRDLGTLGGDFSGVGDINEHQEIVGSSYLKGNQIQHATLWKDGKTIDLGSLYPTRSSYASSINNNGVIVGYTENYDNTGNKTHATLWSEGTIVDLGTLGGGYSYAGKVNDNGQIIGTSNLSGTYISHAVLWENSLMYDLGTIGNASSVASDINNDGQIVGRYYLDNNTNDTAAALWIDKQIFDINTLVDPNSGWYFSDAQFINSKGQILGSGLFNGAQRFYLLSPVPEPETYTMFMAGIGLMAFFKRCRKV